MGPPIKKTNRKAIIQKGIAPAIVCVKGYVIYFPPRKQWHLVCTTDYIVRCT